MDARDNLNLLLDLDPETERWRLRTMFLLSILAHLALVGLLFAASGMIRRHQQLMELEAENEPPPQPTFLVLPPDLAKRLQQQRQANITSDQNRQAQGKAPVVTPTAPPLAYSRGNSTMPEVADGGGKTAPQPPAPPAPKPSAGGGSPTQSPPQPQHQDALKLEDVQKPAASNMHLAVASPEEAIQQSLQAAARGRAQGRIPGPGDSSAQFNNPYSNFSIGDVQVLSDTQGVDFGPYLRQVIEIVRKNWYGMMPESARLGQKGRVQLDFQILKDGNVPTPQPFTSASSGSMSLDQAAISAIHLANPFPPLPREFKGNDLKLRFIFLYNLGYGPQ
ncbi:MAG TPA: cell envelope integrity protein TolA [Terriglobia bacterium]|nr:cell envelope integrity protein TolA [Terriglobia bacterium]